MTTDDVVAVGVKVFDAPSVRGSWRPLHDPDDVLRLMDEGAAGAVAVVRDAGATFLAPLYHELAAIVCLGGTPKSHIGIMSREFQVPCVTGAVFRGPEPQPGADVEVDCSGPEGVVRG
jgi:signal transduction protein with GAF and PtsI domain